jgi:hypothetical protein
VRIAFPVLFLIALIALVVCGFWANSRYPAHNPPIKPDCSSYWDQVYTLECSR